MIKNEIRRMLKEGKTKEEITEKLSEDSCMADEFVEDFPSHCGENANCHECWKERIEEFLENEV